MEQARKKLLLVTAGFPFADTERGFISTEFQQLIAHFDVQILCIGSHEPLIHPFPDEILVERYFHKANGKSFSGLWGVLRAFANRQTLLELGRSCRGQGLKSVLARWKQIIFYRAKANDLAAHMEQKVRSEGIDMVYTYWCTEATLGAAILKQRHPDIRVVTRFHGHDLFCERKATGWQPFRKLIADRVDALVFACRMGQQYFLDTWGQAYEDKTMLAYLGCASAPMPEKAPSDTLRLVSCSNLIPLKRVDHIIDGIRLLPPGLSVRWDHFGDGTERRKLEQMAAEQFGSNVSWEFHGRVPNHELASWYSKLDPDLFLTTTSTEGGVPVSLQEAFSMGIPAIGTAVGGIPELIIPGENGILLPADITGQDVADAIMELADRTAQQKTAMRSNALAVWAKYYDAENNARAFIAELEKMLRS